MIIRSILDNIEDWICSCHGVSNNPESIFSSLPLDAGYAIDLLRRVVIDFLS